MKFTKYQYAFNEKKKKIYALSTYAGKVVKGTATCAPGDNFDMETGKELAAARCNKKVAKLRRNRASRELDAANKAMLQADKHYMKMRQYYEDASDAYTAAIREVNDLEASLGKNS